MHLSMRLISGTWTTNSERSMPPSYRLIDYRLRPAKYVERVMLCDAFRRLNFHVLEDYQYVGLGSVYFADFKIIHRGVGISRMFSIEKHETDAERFEWNKPYAGITMLFGETEQKLSDVDFDQPTITWLDYDGPLVESVIRDIRYVAHAASHGSLLVVTVNAHPRKLNNDGANMLEQIRAEIGDDRIPAETSLDSLRGPGLANFYRTVGDSEVRDAVGIANGVRTHHKRLNYEQLFNFQYEDGAQMTTFGGVFFEEDKKSELLACAFDRLAFIRRGAEAFRIRAPKLTLREIAHLERQLPISESEEIDFGPIPPKDARAYIELYRYMPAFVPVDLV